MKNKIIYVAIIIVQLIILVLFINSKSSITRSSTKIKLQTQMIELQRFTENNLISLTYPINNVSSVDMDYQVTNYHKHGSIYVKLKQENEDWIPIYFGIERPKVNEGELLIHGKIDNIAAQNLYAFSYEKRGKSFQAKWMGRLRSVKKGDDVLLALDEKNPEKIKVATQQKEYKNRVDGRLLDVKPVPGKDLSYNLMVQFEDNGEQVRAPYLHTSYLDKPLPPIGSRISLSFTKQGGAYKVHYVELEPLITGKIIDISKGYDLKLVFGIENYLLKSNQKLKLNELIDKFGDENVSVEAAIDESGDIALTAIFIGKEKVTL